ncbi:hypothetical protein GCM10008015_13530 [Flavobacterium palustre]|uniref:Uncharacterized protein n=1 Tax=Flavobacterium palustre TaxID=1476463 RepID=A0ABQ1HGE6_9FLAO|nr:DUF6642 family protein [Flavobacterium palustre]GGA74114.1 hypothetical protein GCM10008015_13530 [Flavobacterium palustre]
MKNFIFCLEAVADIENIIDTPVIKNLENLALEHQINSIYKSCDTIEGLEESLGALLYDDHNFKDYKVIYLVMPGQENNICLHEYYYSLDEIAELFEGKLKGKIIHFANLKALDLTEEEAQYFLDVTGAKAISGYGRALPPKMASIKLDIAFFNLCQEEDDVVEIVEELHQKHYEACKLLDFRLYY